jgi:plastocyanin
MMPMTTRGNATIARRRHLQPFAWLLVTLVLVGACSDGDEPVAPVDDGDVTVVTLSNFAFSAPTVTIARGETIRWRNSSGSFHTVTPDGHQAFAERQTNTQGQTFETRFDTPGRYRYYCAPHRALGMTGEIVVN